MKQTFILPILLVCCVSINAQSLDCRSVCTQNAMRDSMGHNHGLHINIIYRPLPPELPSIPCELCRQLSGQSVDCPTKTQSEVVASADTVFMRHPGLLPETTSPEVLKQFTAASISQNMDSKINLLESLIRSTSGVIKYRAYLQLTMAILRSQSKNYRTRLAQYLQAMENIDLSVHPQAELLKSDMSFIRAYLAFEQGNIDEGLRQVNRAIAQEPQMLNARLLHTALLVRQFDSMYAAGIRNNRQCRSLINGLFYSAGDIVDLGPCPHQAIAFAQELDGWAKQKQVSTLIPLAYLYKIARQETYLSQLIEQNIPDKFDRLPTGCSRYLFDTLNEIKKVGVK